MHRQRQTGWRLGIKVAFDRVLALLCLALLSPLLLTLAALVRGSMGTPVLFRQARPGRGGHPIEIYKFRTMRDARDANGVPLPDGERLTSLGRAMRATSLDELPQLFNVLLGQLSMVGPRPLLMVYLPRYSPVQARRHEVLPGITGWAQVNGRNAISWEEKFALDVWYVDHWSICLDLRILALTTLRVLQRSGVSKAGHATMPDFLGTKAGTNKPPP